MFVEDYRELKLPDAERIAQRCFLFEEFIENLLKQAPNALKFNHEAERIVIHAHCHAKSLTNVTRHAAARGTFAGTYREAAGHRLLRHGRRVRDAGIEI